MEINQQITNKFGFLEFFTFATIQVITLKECFILHNLIKIFFLSKFFTPMIMHGAHLASVLSRKYDGQGG